MTQPIVKTFLLDPRVQTLHQTGALRCPYCGHAINCALNRADKPVEVGGIGYCSYCLEPSRLAQDGLLHRLEKCALADLSENQRAERERALALRHARVDGVIVPVRAALYVPRSYRG